MSKKLNISEARDQLMGLPEAFQKEDLEAVEITRHGKPVLALISWDEYENYKETMEIMADEKMMASIRRGLDDVRARRARSLSKVRKDLQI
jgi:antitoxin YefM